MKLLPDFIHPSKATYSLMAIILIKLSYILYVARLELFHKSHFSLELCENIAITNPNASGDEITEAARIACAHEFVMELDSGYSTQLGERATNLSGGQRQRLAIARTILSNPKLLVMDEATSALDYDTESRVCQNLEIHSKDEQLCHSPFIHNQKSRHDCHDASRFDR